MATAEDRDVGRIEIDYRLNPAPARCAQRNNGGKDEIFILSKYGPNDAGYMDLHFDIRNTFAKQVRFDSYNVNFREDNPYTELYTIDERNIGDGGELQWLRPQEEYTITLRLTCKQGFHQCGSVPMRVRFNFNLGGRNLVLLKYIHYDFVFEEDRETFHHLVRAQSHQEGEDDWGGPPPDWQHQELEIIWLDNSVFYRILNEGDKDGNRLVYTAELDYYDITSDIRVLMQWPIAEIRIQLGLSQLRFGEDGEPYKKYFRNLLHLEELQQEMDISYYNKSNAKLMPDSQRSTDEEPRFILKLPGLLEKRPSVRKGDRIFAVPKVSGNEYMYEGGVTYVSKENVFIIFHPRFLDELEDYIYNEDDIRFEILFRLNRLPLRLMHRAVDLAVEHRLLNFLFPVSTRPHPQRPLPQRISFINEKIKSNNEQMEAVRHIVWGTSTPAPYIIYGPPGTGKTFTLVEAIKQVHKMIDNSNILVCAPSNSAADLITTGLLNDLPESSVLRLNATSRPFECYDQKIRSVSNVSDFSKKHVYPPKEQIVFKPIVVCTLSTAGRLVSAELNNHFTHLFIDEAGFATEPETLIPVSLINLDPNKTDQVLGQVVLAGDPQQLGPVIRSSQAEELGLTVSLLKRLMDLPKGPYVKRDGKDKFNPNFVTKLLQSFRSHPNILKLPNELFYDGELLACANKHEREKFCKWKHLSDKAKRNEFPLIFHAVNFGREQKEKSSPSWFNPHEVIEVSKWVEKLLPHGNKKPYIKAKNIGIITPYHQQVKKMRIALRNLEASDKKDGQRARNLPDIEVGSVEKFQGDEREVIIISTVRSQNILCEVESVRAKLGFLTNKKRFNVAVTRAKALLIVVGNPEVLVLDPMWRALIKFIIENGGYTGKPSESELELVIRAADDRQEQENVQAAREAREDGNDYSEYQQMVDETWDPRERE